LPLADLTITIDRAELEDVMIGAAKLVDKVKAGKAKLEGNTQVLEQLKATLVAFDPFFEILPGTKPAATPASKTPKDEVFEDDAPVLKEP
jgi:alkyl sulfatase BDS1-like metallo-beta-lactamase superfamily hydrolase